MNDLEKRSFYSFLTLYIGSSLIFLGLLGYWYYMAQKNSLHSSVHYEMQHLSDTLSRHIIQAHMRQEPLELPPIPKDLKVALVKKNGTLFYGQLPKHLQTLSNGFYNRNHLDILISDAPQEHLGIEYAVIYTGRYNKELTALKQLVLTIMTAIALGIIAVAWILSKIFMRPIHQKVSQIEAFIKAISHELNTPITALQMSSKRALQKKVYDPKILKNISISTKQLYAIYQSLTYLSFSDTIQETHSQNLRLVIEENVSFYNELCEAKKIQIKTELEDFEFNINKDQAVLLFSNLLSNAIKYSMPNTTITLTLHKGVFCIEDEGIGIAKEKLREIFDLYQRATDYSGGFGVGLNIVSSICKSYHIRLDVHSKEGQGSRFTLDFTHSTTN